MSFMFKCKSADKYQAKRPPKCNGGEGCIICKQKWAAAQKKAANGKVSGKKSKH